MNNHVVIMAGGIGSRFWPLGTPECPQTIHRYIGMWKNTDSANCREIR